MPIPLSSPVSEQPYILEVPIECIQYDSSWLQYPIAIDDLEDEAEKITQGAAPSSVVVQEISDNQYSLLFGIRNLIAANIAKSDKIEVIVLKKQNSSPLSNVLTNHLFNWDDLDPIECAKAYEWLCEHHNYNNKMLANLRKLSQPAISNQLRLLKLPEQLQTWLSQGKISKSHCWELLKITDSELQLKLAEQIIDEDLTFRAGKDLIAPFVEEKSKKSLVYSIKKHRNKESGTISIPYDSNNELEQIIKELKRISLS